MIRTKLALTALGLALLMALAAVATAPKPSHAVQPCPATDCDGPNACERKAGSFCSLANPNGCVVAAC